MSQEGGGPPEREDTVRSQSVSGYGYERPTTPHLDKVAEEGLVFLDANAPATWSVAATRSGEPS